MTLKTINTVTGQKVTSNRDQALNPTEKMTKEVYERKNLNTRFDGTPVHQAQRLSTDVLTLTHEVLSSMRTTLMVNFRFLDRALWRMPFVQSPVIDGMGTDGRDLSYEPQKVLESYGKETDEALRDYLHLILHCVFYHPFVGNDVNMLAWNLSSDIVVEESCIDLAGDRFPSRLDPQRIRAIEALKGQLGNLSAEKIYRHILSQGISPEEAEVLESLFHRDDHAPWYKDRPLEESDDDDANKSETSPDANPEMVPDEAECEQSIGMGDKALDDSHEQGDKDNGSWESPESDSDSEDDPDETGEDTESDPRQSDDSNDEMESEDENPEQPEGQSSDKPEDFQDGPDGQGKELWESVSKQLKVDLELQSKQFGTKAGSLVKQLAVSNRKRYDYKDFLRRFCSIDEEMVLNDEEFDLVSYTYGLRLYGNLPLIEPLEFKETSRVRDFCIAIDTSESCDGALVRRFIEETYNILKSSESFFRKVNIHIIQCDARVQQDVKITSDQEFEEYMRNFAIHGLGGTDFRPVFRRIDTLLERGEFEDLKGLIYFTDGYGTFPAAPPNYETVFAFIDDGFGNTSVPAWAFKLVLDSASLDA